jgi:DNA polymerase-3 subunit beta
MKLLEISRDELLIPLQAVTGIVEKRHTLPILSNVLIERENNKVHLIATDLEIQITTTRETKTSTTEKQSLTVSAKKLQDILRALPEATTTTLDLQVNKLQVKAGKSRFNLQTMPFEGFPRMAISGALITKISLTQKKLQDLLTLVQFAMAQQDIRYYLNGLLIVIEENKIKVIATDGHRLSFAQETLNQQYEKIEVILPRKAILELSKQLTASEEPIEIEIYPKQVKFIYSNSELITKVIEGKFPDYNRVIPLNYDKKIKLKREDLLHSLQRAAILSNEKFRGVRWLITENTLAISCNNNEQEDSQEEIEVNYTDELLDMGFNITYLLDFLNNVHEEILECTFGSSSSSMLITIPGKEDYRYVVMPMKI